jgi:hypothetical protein
VLLAGADECYADALAVLVGENREPIHVSSPAVPGGDQCAYDLAVAISDQQVSGCFREQSLYVLQLVGGARVSAASLTPSFKTADASRGLPMRTLKR